MARRILLALVVLVAVAVVLPPLWFAVFPDPAPELPPAGSRVELPGGVGVNVVEAGAGPPVLLIHGLPGCAYDWRVLAERLSASGSRALAYDRVGYGHSDPRPEGPHSVQQNAEDLVDLLEALDLRDATLVGWSYGGVAAMIAATLDPSRIGRLVLVGTGGPDSPDAQPPEPPGIVRVLYSYPVIAWRIRVPPLSRLLMEAVSEAAYSGRPQPEWWIPGVRANFARWDTLVTYREEMFSLEGELEPSAIELPVLLLHGDVDQLAPLSIAHYLDEIIPDSELAVVEGGSHMLPVTHAQWLTDQIVAFRGG